MFFHRPSYRAYTSKPDVIALTDEVDEVVLDSLKKSLPNHNTQSFDSIDLKNAGRVHLLGSGLETFDLPKIKNHPVSYYPPKANFRNY